MRFGIISDIHNEHGYWDYTPDPDLFYLIAGDIYTGVYYRNKWLERFGDNCFWIKGNHDYYHETFNGAENDFKSLVIDGIKIAGAPLWTEMHYMDWQSYKNYMVDFTYIKDMTYDKYVRVYDIHQKFLFNSGADVWVIHHCPSFLSVHERYKNSYGNQFFASELKHKILDMANPPKLIVHGHTHEEFDYMIGDTRIVCHPRGYPHEHSNYKSYAPKIVEI